jgi:hypothetical protein
VAEKTLHKLSTEEKVGQLFMIWVRAGLLNIESPEYLQLGDNIRMPACEADPGYRPKERARTWGHRARGFSAFSASSLALMWLCGTFINSRSARLKLSKFIFLLHVLGN